MPGAMEFGLLGPLVVRSGETEVPVRRGHPRALLALLLLEANRPVSLNAIIDALWGSKPPQSAPVAIRSYIRSLRLALGQAGQERISTEPRGYLIRVADGELDLARFEQLLSSALVAARGDSWQEASWQAREALSCWRGKPLADIESDTLVLREAPRLAELRLQALETCVEADLRLGGHSEVVSQLEQLCAAHPLREHLHALLMLALYRCGRQAEALAAYQRVRTVLIEELGADPDTELQTLHQRILGTDPTLAVRQLASPAVPEARPGTPVTADAYTTATPVPTIPRQLPAAVGCFTGRDAELAALTGLLNGQPRERRPTMAISAICGTAGVGKTALAVQWAHEVAMRFQDGQLYLNLHGYDRDEPVAAADALAGFLRALGVPGTDIPDGTEERSRLYRSKLAGRRVLVLLDNARDGEQVRPLLPGDPGCVTLVTSRDTLAGLVAADGARRLDLDVLPLADAVALLRSLIGGRADGDSVATSALAGLCARLPLALRIAAELAAARHTASLASLVAELEASRLDYLDAGEDRADVRAVFSWSVRQLPGEVAWAFELTSLHPGEDLDLYAAAALTGTSTEQARPVLGRLHRASLIQAAGPGRYSMHDLLRAYAIEQAAARDTGQGRQALTRLFDYYLAATAAAMDILFPAEAHRRPRIPASAAAAPTMPGGPDARAWLDRERTNLVAVVVHCADHGWADHAKWLASVLGQYLGSGGHFSEAITIFSHALGIAHRSGDRAAEATIFNAIGRVHGERGRFQQAGDHFRQALTLFRELADRTGQARAIGNIGFCEIQLGCYEQAACHQQEAVAIFRESGDRFGEARAVGNLGLTRLRQGHYLEAADYHQQALDLCREIGDRHGEAWALGRLGIIDMHLDRHQHAAGYLQQALAMYREMGDTADEPEILVRLGEAYLGLGHHEQAAASLEQAMAMSHEIGDPVMEAEAHNGLGDILLQTGQAGKARAHHAAALRLASEARSPREQARAHSGLARACQTDGDSFQARCHWQEALDLYTQLGAPEADQIRFQLADTDSCAGLASVWYTTQGQARRPVMSRAMMVFMISEVPP